MRRARKRSGWVVLLVIALVAALLLRFVFVLRNVKIHGSVNVSHESIIRAAELDFGKSIFLVNRDSVRAGVNAMGVHELKSLRLRLPDTIVMEVEPRTRTAMLLYGGKIVVLDENAVVMELVDDVPDRDMIYISGLTPTSARPGSPLGLEERQLQACRDMLGAISALGAGSYVSELSFNDLNDLRLITRAGATVLLGDAGDMENKIAWVKAVAQDLEKRGEGGGTIDVSGGNRADYRPAGL